MGLRRFAGRDVDWPCNTSTRMASGRLGLTGQAVPSPLIPVDGGHKICPGDAWGVCGSGVVQRRRGCRSPSVSLE